MNEHCPTPHQTTLSRFLLISLIGIAAMTLIGCSKIQAPKFTMLGVREVERTDTRTVYSFRMQATNPNKEPIPLREVSYSVTLDNQYTFTGVRSPETTLHIYGQHEFEIPAVFELGSNQITGIIDYTLIGSTKYLKPGKFNEVLYDSKISVPKSEFTFKGKIDVDQPAASAVGQ